MAPTTFFVPLQVPSCQPVLVGGLVLADDHLHLSQGGLPLHLQVVQASEESGDPRGDTNRRFRNKGNVS